MHFRDDVIAFIGPACAFALEPVARLAAYWNTPIITGMGDQVGFVCVFLIDFYYTPLVYVENSSFLNINCTILNEMLKMNLEHSLCSHRRKVSCL